MMEDLSFMSLKSVTCYAVLYNENTNGFWRPDYAPDAVELALELKNEMTDLLFLKVSETYI